MAVAHIHAVDQKQNLPKTLAAMIRIATGRRDV